MKDKCIEMKKESTNMKKQKRIYIKYIPLAQFFLTE